MTTRLGISRQGDGRVGRRQRRSSWPCVLAAATLLASGCEGAVDDHVRASQPSSGSPGLAADDAGSGCRLGETMACYTGPIGSDGVGQCREGRSTCVDDPIEPLWGPCTDDTVPAPEQCSTAGVDEDCDGRTPACNTLWSFALAVANTSQAARSVAVDAEENVYVAGAFAGRVSLGGELLTSAGFVLPDSGSDDVFLAKYDRYGNHVWSRHFGDASAQAANQVMLDASGDVIVLGRAFGVIDFGTGELDAAGTDDIFVAKLRGDGTPVWGVILGGIDPDRAERMAVDSQGEIWVAGAFTTEADFGTGLLQTRGVRDAILLKLGGASGAVELALPIGGGGIDQFGDKTGDNYGFGVGVHTSTTEGGTTDFVYVTGYFSETIQIGAGPELASAGGKDVFLAKLDADGNHIWSQRFGSVLDDLVYDLVVDPVDGHVVITGGFQEEMGFGGAPLTSAGSFDIFLARLDAGGNHVFSARYGDVADQMDFATFATNTWLSLDLDQDGNIYLAGPLVGTAAFGDTPLTSPEGRMDAFLVKLDRAGNHVHSARYGDPGTQQALDLAVTPSGDVLLVGRFFSDLMDFGPSGEIRGIGVQPPLIASGGDGFVARVPPYVVVEEPDAGPAPGPDAAVPAPDGGAMPLPDAGMDPGGGGDGCSCELGKRQSGPSNTGMLLLLVIAAMGCWRVRRA
jgi:hypothetical protein